jgi:hypothetical protein
MNIDEMKNQLNNSEELPETEEETEETPAAEDQEEQEEENNEGGEGDSEESKENDNNSQGAEGGEQFVMPKKFEGKSADEVAKSYSELEKMHTKKMEEMQKEIDALKKKPAGGDDDDDKNKDGEPEWEKMTPKDFAKKIISEAKKASKGAYQEANQTKAEVSKEIAEAKKSYPNLTKNQHYRDTVIAIVEAAAGQGKVIKLKDACAKVEALIGEKQNIAKKDETRMKQAKAQIETMNESPSGSGDDGEESKIKQGMLKGSGGALGGLGF